MKAIRLMLAALLAAALFAAGPALAEETDFEPTERDFIGEWADEDGACSINAEPCEGGGWLVEVQLDIEQDGEYVYDRWTYACVFDEEACALNSILCVRQSGDYEPDSEETLVDFLDEPIEGVLEFDEDGSLIWNDPNVEASDEMLFERADGSDDVGLGGHFVGQWDSERMSIAIDARGDEYDVSVVGSNSAAGRSMWVYICEYDEATDSLVCDGETTGGMKINVTTDENGDEEMEFVYDDGAAVFSFNEDGQLVWDDEAEDAGADRVFERAGE